MYVERPVPVEVVRYRSPPIPAELLRECPAVDTAIRTNGELLAAYLEANKRLRQCSADKAGLRGMLQESF